MKVYFRDVPGVVGVDVDEYNIQFLDGNAYFSDGEKEYKIPVGSLIEIIAEE